MSPTPYQKGRDAEYYVMGVLRNEHHYLVQRSYASRGPRGTTAAYDLLAVAPGTGRIALIEVKSKSARMSPGARKALAEYAVGYGAVPLLAHYTVESGKAVIEWNLLTLEGEQIPLADGP